LGGDGVFAEIEGRRLSLPRRLFAGDQAKNGRESKPDGVADQGDQQDHHEEDQKD